MAKTKYLDCIRQDIREVVNNAVNAALLEYKKSAESSNSETPSLVYGISGLANLLKVSYPTALKIKNSGKISYHKAGDKFIFNVHEVLNQLKNNVA